MSEINVLYTFDSRFWRMAAVSINSLMESNSHNNITVYCMVAPHTRGYHKIRSIIQKHNGLLIWRPIHARENPFHTCDHSRWSPVIFFRLFAHRAFPELNKILYLDSDTLVYEDLAQLYNTNLANFAMGAVRDMAPTSDANNPDGIYVKNFKKQYLKHNLYVNSGVLLLNLRKIRENEHAFHSICIPLKYPDQDILNIALDGQIQELPLRYNCIPNTPIDKKFTKSNAMAAMESIAIAHFYSVKPYVYDMAPRGSYAMFATAAEKIGMHPDDFMRDDIKRILRNHNCKTQIPFLHINKHGQLRFFCFKI